MSLYSLSNNMRFRVEKLPPNDLLRSIGVREGQTMSVLTKQLSGGPIVINFGRRSLAIGRDVAEQIIVSEVC